MSKYRFEHKSDSGVTLSVEVDDADGANANADAVVGAFVQFLRGVTFSNDTIAKFIDHELAG